MSNPLLAQDTIRNIPSNDGTLKKDTIASYENNAPSSGEDDDFNIFLLLFATAAVCFMMGFFLIGVIVFLFLLLIFIFFLTTGVISASVFIGVYKKSLSSGFKTFTILCSSLIGIVCGIVGFGLVSYLFNLNLERSTISISGSICGLIAGVLLGIIIFKIIRRMLSYLKKKLRL